MTTTQLGATATRLHRAAQDVVAVRYQRMIRQAWRLLDPDDVDGTTAVWLAVVLPLVMAGREASAAAATAYLRTFALAEGVRAPIVVVPAVTVARRAAETSLRVTGPVGIKSLTAHGWEVRAAAAAMERLMAGAAKRHILNGGRQTITETIKAAPNVGGWRRVGVGSCEFCRMLIGRGEVYAADSARFASHDNCNCSAEPAYGGGEPASVIQFTASKGNQSPEDLARVRQWISDNRHSPDLLPPA